MASKKTWKKRALAFGVLLLREKMQKLILEDTLKALTPSSDGVQQEQAEDSEEEVLAKKMKFAEMTMVNGYDVNAMIRSNPHLTNSEIGEMIGVSHQFITAWKLYHTGWEKVDAAV